MAVRIFMFICSSLLVCAHCEDTNSTTVELSKNQDPTSLNSRFFDLGGIINQLLPGINQGNQGGPGRNPAQMGFPTNSQFYPAVSIQSQNPQMPTAPGNTWPVLDDAKQYPSQGRPQYPNQGNFGGFQPIQNQNQGNFMGSQQLPNPPYPNQVGGMPSNQYPQYTNQLNNGGPMQTQYPNQGKFGTSFPDQYPQYPNQGNFGGMPSNQFPQYPNQNVGLYTNQFPQYPNQINNGSPVLPQYPNQGATGKWNQNQRPGTGQGSDGTLDTLVPPQWNTNQPNDVGRQNPWNTDQPNDFSPVQFNSSDSNSQRPEINDQPIGSDPSEGTNAILGRPVIVPPTTTEAGQIVYPSSTQSAAKRQCVQDCQTTTEYNPVCGSDNVTYINPGKFVCARNCGVDVFVARRGRCPNDTPFPRNVFAANPVG